MILKFSRQQDAAAVARAYAETYPAYTFKPVKPAGAKMWRVACSCRVTSAFLQYAKG
jgi:hypothetical protein